MRRGQSSTVSPLLFQTSQHHRVFPTPLVLQRPISHGTLSSPCHLLRQHHQQDRFQGFAFEVMVSKNQTLR